MTGRRLRGQVSHSIIRTCGGGRTALDPCPAERHGDRADETTIQIARGCEQGHGATVHVSKAKLARLAGLPGWPRRDLISQSPDQIPSNEVRGREDREVIQAQVNEWKPELPRLHKGEHQDA